MRDLCQTHKLVLAPDGKCVLCRRPARPLFTIHEEQETLISQVFTGLLGVGLLVGVISLVYASQLDEGYTGGRSDRRSLASAAAAIKQQAADQKAETDQPAEDGAQQAEAKTGDATAKPAEKRDAAHAEAKPPPAQPASTAKPRATPEALRAVKVTMYATPWCEICDRARDFLNTRGVTLIEQDIERDPAAAQKLAKLNPGMSVPTFEIAGQAQVGFSPWVIEDALQAAAQQSFAARKP